MGKFTYRHFFPKCNPTFKILHTGLLHVSQLNATVTLCELDVVIHRQQTRHNILIYIVYHSLLHTNSTQLCTLLMLPPLICMPLTCSHLSGECHVLDLPGSYTPGRISTNISRCSLCGWSRASMKSKTGSTQASKSERNKLCLLQHCTHRTSFRFFQCCRCTCV